MLKTLLPSWTRRPSVTVPYPRWGEEIPVEDDEPGEATILRVLKPADPATAPAGLLFVHGMNEYIGRYAPIARHFARRYIVGGFDLYAHGLSNPALREADRAIRTGAGRCEVAEDYLAQAALSSLDPMRGGLDRVCRRFLDDRAALGPGRRPLFIVAHSLGALVACSWLLDRREDEDLRQRVAGIVLLGPAFAVPEVPGWRGWYCNPVVRLSFRAETLRSAPEGEAAAGSMLWAGATARVLGSLFEGLSRPGWRRIATPGPPDWVLDYLTDWEEERQRHRTDGYMIRRTLLRYVKAVEREIACFRHRMANFDLPYLLVYSGRDPITAAWGAEDFAAATVKRHPANRIIALRNNYHHEHLFGTPEDTAKLLDRIDGWLDQRVADSFSAQKIEEVSSEIIPE